MSDFALFSLKDQSLLDFDKRRREEPESLHGVYGVNVIPCDSLWAMDGTGFHSSEKIGADS